MTGIRLDMRLGGCWEDMTPLIVPGSLAIEDVALNDRRTSSVSTVRFALRFHPGLRRALDGASGKIGVRLAEDYSVIFDGEMEPDFSLLWDVPDEGSAIECEAVDFSVALDRMLPQSASYPSEVGGEPYWIYRRDAPDISILPKLLEMSGLADHIDPTAPDIEQRIRHIAWTAGENTARAVIDPLLADYGWALRVKGDRITWIRTAFPSFHCLGEIGATDILGTVRKIRRYTPADGVRIEWPALRIMEDMRLWRGRLPIGDSSDPLPGEPIAAGRFWPEDSDILDIWQRFSVDWSDTDWAEGKTRLRNEDLALVASSDWRLVDRKDEAIALDPYRGDPANPIVYEPQRAMLRYKNSGAGSAKLYWSEIRGTALVRDRKMETRLPDGAAEPEVYEAAYIYDKDSAQRLARIRLMWQTKGAFRLEFDLAHHPTEPGEVYLLRQRPIYEGPVQIASVARSQADELAHCVAYSIDGFGEEAGSISTAGWQGSGATPPGEDAATALYVYLRSYAEPPAPVGQNPAGWTSGIPDGTEPVWMSSCLFRANGEQKGGWTRPVRISGLDRGSYRGAVASLPDDPIDGDFALYAGETGGGREYGHIYEYVALDGIWRETTDSDKVMTCQMDALRMAADTGRTIYASALFVDVLVARKLVVGGGTERSGFLARFLDDDGTGSQPPNPLIEIRNEGEKLFWLDENKKLNANFAKVTQYLPFSFNDSIDSSHPAVFSFYIPDGTIEWVRLRVKAQRFRTYAKAAKLYDATETSSSGPRNGNDYTVRLNCITQEAETLPAGDHTHQYSQPTKTAPASSGGVISSERITASGRTESETITASGSTDSAASGGYTGSTAVAVSGETEVSPASLGGHSHSISILTRDHNHSVLGTSHSHGYSFSGSHSHGYSFSGSHRHELSGTSHSHDLDGIDNRDTDSSGSHRHEVGIPHYSLDVTGTLDHTHSVDISHSHDLVLGIIEGEIASDLEWALDEGSGWGTPKPLASGDEAVISVAGPGWKDLRISSATLGRVQCQIIVKIGIDTEIPSHQP